MTGSPPPGERPPTRRAWIDERLGLSRLQDALAGGQMPGGASFWRALGAAAAGLFAVEAVTGLFLSFFYAPSAQTAWASVAYLQDQLPGGWFVRGLHGFGASALVVVAGLHLLQVLLFAAYRKPREANWIVGLGLLALTIAFALSGALLPYDQKGYWAKQVEASILGRVPLVGGPLQRIAQGGAAFGNLTVTHAFAVHALALPAAFLALLALHLFLHRRHGPTPRWWLSARELAERAAPVWPDQAARNVAAAALALAVVAVATLVRHGPALEGPADPASSYLARPDWYVLPLYELRMLFDGPAEIVATVIIPGIASGLLVALPFLDRGPSRRPADRRRVLGATAAGLTGLAALSAVGLAREARDPRSAGARAAEEARASQARRLALKGVPPEGGLAVFRNDPLNQARELWTERCAGCHGLTGTGGDKGPDFKGYGSRAWIRSFLTQPDGRLYMGPAKIERGMKPVTGSADELDALTEMVYAETGAPDAIAARAAAGRALLADKDCDTCHEVDGETENAGPNLKGRGTLAWVQAVIADAGQPRLFGDRNKMPRFADKLTAAEIEALARFVLSQKTAR